MTRYIRPHPMPPHPEATRQLVVYQIPCRGCDRYPCMASSAATAWYCCMKCAATPGKHSHECNAQWEDLLARAIPLEQVEILGPYMARLKENTFGT